MLESERDSNNALNQVAGASQAIDRMSKKIREREIKEYIKDQGLMMNKKNIARAE